MGSTRKFVKQVGKHPDQATSKDVTLTCGCETSRDPSISSPVKKWFCCGEYRKAKRR